MQFINSFKEGERIKGIYLCKKRISATTKNGKDYEILALQDKTGSIDAKIWNPTNPSFGDFKPMDYVYVVGDITLFNDSLQFNLQRAIIAPVGSFEPEDYLPSADFPIEDMYKELLSYAGSVKNKYLSALLNSFFVEDETFIKSFKAHTAAKTVHHDVIGGLLQHSLAVTKLCDFYAKNYKFLNRDLLISIAMLHDIGKTKELSLLPENDYTDEGQLIGHIVIGTEMITNHIIKIDGFPEILALEVKHCILSHHGKMEYGSPKIPAIAEAMALNFADDMDARMNYVENLEKGQPYSGEWMGYQRIMETNIRKTSIE